ncbi:hypothetical protein AKO1_000786, partial [Acrasis kona]
MSTPGKYYKVEIRSKDRITTSIKDDVLYVHPDLQYLYFEEEIPLAQTADKGDDYSVINKMSRSKSCYERNAEEVYATYDGAESSVRALIKINVREVYEEMFKGTNRPKLYIEAEQQILKNKAEVVGRSCLQIRIIECESELIETFAFDRHYGPNKNSIKLPSTLDNILLKLVGSIDLVRMINKFLPYNEINQYTDFRQSVATHSNFCFDITTASFEQIQRVIREIEDKVEALKIVGMIDEYTTNSFALVSFEYNLSNLETLDLSDAHIPEHTARRLSKYTFFKNITCFSMPHTIEEAAFRCLLKNLPVVKILDVSNCFALYNTDINVYPPGSVTTLTMSYCKLLPLWVRSLSLTSLSIRYYDDGFSLSTVSNNHIKEILETCRDKLGSVRRFDIDTKNDQDTSLIDKIRDCFPNVIHPKL